MQRSVVNVNVNVGSYKRRVCRSAEAECRLAEKSRVCLVAEKARGWHGAEERVVDGTQLR